MVVTLIGWVIGQNIKLATEEPSVTALNEDKEATLSIYKEGNSLYSLSGNSEAFLGPEDDSDEGDSLVTLVVDEDNPVVCELVEEMLKGVGLLQADKSKAERVKPKNNFLFMPICSSR